MLLEKLLLKLDYALLQGTVLKEIKDIVQDSRKVSSGDAFVCIRGMNADGHEFISGAVEQGASAVITDVEIRLPEDKQVTVILVEDTRKAFAFLSAAYFDYPAEQLKTIGITGTKGKTTTSYMIKEILEQEGIKTGLIGTIEIQTGTEMFSSVNTTPDAYTLHKYLRQMVENGCEAAVIETSSQAFKLDRTAGIMFDYGAFLNISSDHIGPSEHSSFDEYLSCKSMLFCQCVTGIVNIDDRHVFDILKGHTCEVETFGLSKEAELRAEHIKLYRSQNGLGTAFWMVGTMNFDVKLNMPGEFNIYNALCAATVARHFNVSIKSVAAVFEKMSVKGRIEFYHCNSCKNPVKPYQILIDYAHNADSLEHLLTTLRSYHPKRLVCLFGCGGNRSKLRRYEMGKVAARLADFTIVTSDNPRFEEPEDVIADIVESITKGFGNYIAITDRRKAVRYAVTHAEEGDLIVLAGKGHEDYQEIKGRRYPMDEREILKEIFNEE